MAATNWIAGDGVGLTWTSCFVTTDINSLASANYTPSTSTVIANGTALDFYADLSFSLTVTTGSTGSPYLDFYLMPLNGDGTTYGSNTAKGATIPPLTYRIGTVILPNSLTAAVATGQLRGIVLPAGNFKFGVANQTGNALAATAGTIWYRTYNEAIA